MIDIVSLVIICLTVLKMYIYYTLCYFTLALND